jgi:opacity protein-like surface antigen
LLAPDVKQENTTTTVQADLTVNRRGPRTTLGFEAGAEHNMHEGDADIPDGTDWRVALTLADRGPLSTATARADYRRDAVHQTELLDTGVLGGDAERVTKSISGTYNRTLSARDRLETNAGFTDVDFEGDVSDLRSPYRAINLGIGLVRTLSPRDTASARLSSTIMNADDPRDTNSTSLTAMFGLEHRRTQQLTLRLGAGVGAVRRTRDTLADPDLRDTETDPTLTLDMGATYTLPRLTLSASLTQGFSPSALGELNVTRTITGDAAYALTPAARLTFTVMQTSSYADVDFLPIDDARRHYISLGPGVTWQFMPDWRLSAGYRFRHREGGAGTASSNVVFASVAYNFTIAR